MFPVFLTASHGLGIRVGELCYREEWSWQPFPPSCEIKNGTTNPTHPYVFMALCSMNPRGHHMSRPFHNLSYINWACKLRSRITVTARFKAWTVFVRLNAAVLGSGAVRGMEVCECLFCIVLNVGSGLATGWSPSKESYRMRIKTKKLKLRGLSPRANYTDRATAACRWS
jgi:hypothetical protein